MIVEIIISRATILIIAITITTMVIGYKKKCYICGKEI